MANAAAVLNSARARYITRALAALRRRLIPVHECSPRRGHGAPPARPVAGAPADSNFWALTLGSVGVVYGDIGTSPLYAFREAVMAASESGAVTRDNVLGVLSMILWALIVVVTIKYVLILLRADNNGEGGTLSLTALAARAHRPPHAIRACCSA